MKVPMYMCTIVLALLWTHSTNADVVTLEPILVTPPPPINPTLPALPPVNGDPIDVLRIRRLVAAIANLTRAVDDLTSSNTALHVDILYHEHPKVKPPFVPPVHYHHNSSCDCCTLLVAKDQCYRKVAGLNLCQIGDGVYYFSPPITVNNPGLTFFDASDFCRSHGMELVSPESMIENALLKARVSSVLGNTAGSFWTSINDVDTNGLYIFYGTGYPVGTFTDWGLNFSGTNVENCGVIEKSITPPFVKWDDRKCLQQNRFICELSKPCLGLVSINGLCP